MASDVDIANRALSKLGEARITSLTDNNKGARAMNSRFEMLRDAEVEAGAWRFAIKRVNLPATAEVPEWGYSKIFARPSDDLRPLTINGYYVNYRTVGVYVTGPSTRAYGGYSIVDGKIQTDMSAPLEYEYVARVTNSGLFNSLFVEVFACRLAADAAEELTQSNQKQQAALFQYQKALREARRTHAIWTPPTVKGSGSFLQSRAW